MPYKNLIRLKDISDTELNQILDTAGEMKRIVLSRVKRGPQLLGKVLAIDGSFSPIESVALQLSIQYLSGIAVTSCCKSDKDMISLKAMGVDFVVSSAPSELLLSTSQFGGGLIKFGGIGESPLKTLAILLTIKQKIETLKSVEVTLLGNLSDNQTDVEALSEVLRRYESRVSAYVSDKALVAAFKEKNVRVDSDVNMAISGADVLVDYGCNTQDNFAVYGDYMGLTTDHIKLAQMRVPLLFKSQVFDKELLRMVDYPQSATQDYYANLTAVNMALMYLINRN